MLVLLWGISWLSHMLLLYFQLHLTVGEFIYCFAIISKKFKYLSSYLDPFIKILTDLWVFKGNLSHHAPLLNSISKLHTLTCFRDLKTSVSVSCRITWWNFVKSLSIFILTLFILFYIYLFYPLLVETSIRFFKSFKNHHFSSN